MLDNTALLRHLGQWPGATASKVSVGECLSPELLQCLRPRQTRSHCVVSFQSLSSVGRTSLSGQEDVPRTQPFDFSASKCFSQPHTTRVQIAGVSVIWAPEKLYKYEHYFPSMLRKPYHQHLAGSGETGGAGRKPFSS